MILQDLLHGQSEQYALVLCFTDAVSHQAEISGKLMFPVKRFSAVLHIDPEFPFHVMIFHHYIFRFRTGLQWYTDLPFCLPVFRHVQLHFMGPFRLILCDQTALFLT